MGMYDDKVVLCGANSYNEKYYLHDVGGVVTLVFEENGELCFEVTSEDFDPTFDDIGSRLLIKKLQTEKSELLEALQMYFRVFFLNEDMDLDGKE